MGPLMLDLSGCELSAEEKELLGHPTVGGVILFSRNYDCPQQVSELTGQIRQYSRNDVLIAVDHEGGRVQRFREHFSAIPAMGKIYPAAGQSLEQACHKARRIGWLLAAEVLAVGIDISFAPVLDIWGISEVIGDRSFHAEPDIIAAVASALIEGMNQAGMKATGKHFPGHGNVLEDSHIAIPVDKRSKEEIFGRDMAIFKKLIGNGLLAGIMPAHVIYPAVDELPAGFSSTWLDNTLKSGLGFDGLVFSDDLAMEGAAGMGNYAERAYQALEAGCDMVLVCNDRKGAIEVIDALPINDDQDLGEKIRAMRGIAPFSWQGRQSSEQWQQAHALLAEFG